MNKKIFCLIPVVLVLASAMLFFVASQNEPDFTPPGNISLHDYYCILNPACIVGDLFLPDYNVTADWCNCSVNWSDVQNAPPALNVSNFMNLTELANTYLNLSGTNANQNIDISPYNLTAGWFFGDGSQLTGIVGDNSSWNESYADTLYVNIDGDTMTGDLNMSGNNITDVNWFYGKIDWSYVQNKFITAVDNIYIHMVGTTATFNETKLNESIDARAAFADTNCSVSGSCPNIIYWANESILNVNSSNSSTWWAGVSGWVSGWFKQTGNDLDFNETKLNETIDARAVNIDGDNMTGDLNMTNNSVIGLYQVNFTDGGYIYDNGTALILGHT